LRETKENSKIKIPTCECDGWGKHGSLEGEEGGEVNVGGRRADEDAVVAGINLPTVRFHVIVRESGMVQIHAHNF
jgi:hypothetical protein